MQPVLIDAAFPGGNIIVESVEGETVYLRQDRRTTPDWWFYWSFRLSGAKGRTITFRFTDGDVFGAQGPCFSPDGSSWRWLGRGCVCENSFHFNFREADGGWFSFCIPYTGRHLEAFLAAQPAVERHLLVHSEKGRPMFRLAVSSRKGDLAVLATARAHACETMGSYALEGLIDFWLGDTPESVFLREYVDLHAVPFLDADGVEDGDQGKNRAPHDHNRDFTNSPLYASTRALIGFLPSIGERLALSLDLHCPWIRDGRNEEIFMAMPPPPWDEETARFARLLEGTQKGGLAYRTASNLPYGQEWNVGLEGDSQQYIAGHSTARFGVTIEIPYALAGGATVNEANTRAFGMDVGRAVARYLRAGSL